MKVKSIHFIPSVPGQPVYEMSNGEIRIPFPDGRVGVMVYLSEAEVLNTLTDPSPKNKNIIITQFAEARQLIGKGGKRLFLFKPGQDPKAKNKNVVN